MIEQNKKKLLLNIDDLFTTQEERDNAKLEKVIDIKLEDIEDFPNHPFKVVDDDEMKNMRDSIIENGVLHPALVRQKVDGKYEMISGHRRKFACALAGKETIPCIVRDLTDEEAVIIMVDSNMQREEILPSEKAFSYKLKLEALKHQGKRNDLTSSQVGTKSRIDAQIGEEYGDSRNQVQRYIRLTELIPEILELVDNKKIGFNPAVELSYLTKEEQQFVLESIRYNLTTPSHAQAIQMKYMSQSGSLSKVKIEGILSEQKPNQVTKIKLNDTRIRNVLPNSIKYNEEDKIEDFIVKAVEFYSKHLQKQKQMEGR